jgi:uncharacterized glyoxalase superfamily protein PhnB
MKFAYCIIYVPNVPETVAFYEKAFGLQRRFVHESGEYAELETGDTALAFAAESLVGANHEFVPNRASAKPAGAEVGLVTDDVQAAFDHAISAGAVRELEPTVKPWGQTVSYVRDNNGFLVEICSKVG